MKISYSSFRKYIDCPRKYKMYLDRIDPPEEPSKYFALYGMLIEKFFEHLSNNHYKNNPNLRPDQVRMLMSQHWRFILDSNYVDWNEPWCRESSEEIFESAFEDAIKCMNTMDFFKNTKSEVVYETILKKSQDILTGRLDFVYTNSDGKHEILDGKGTPKIETNVDNDQLYFYALLYLIRHKRLPDKLGFVYYRYQKVVYIDFDMDIIMAFKDKLALVKRAIKSDTTWEPKVKITKQCKYCDYKLICDAYIAKKDEGAAKRAERSPLAQQKTGGVQDILL